MNDRYFDLGNLSVNNGFEDEHDRALLELYFDEPVTERALRLAAAHAHRLRLPRGDVGRRAAAALRRSTSTTPPTPTEHFDAARARRGRPARGGVAGALPRPRELPERARVVIVGGGVGGTSIAYHLAQLGERDVVLVDRAELTSGSTFHSAGLVGQLRGSVSLTRMMMDSVELYRRLGDACGWVECGGLRLACTPEREEELHRQVGWSRTFGLPLELLSADEAAALFPLMSTDGVRAASYLPTDGYLDPSQLTYALAEGAREGGCRIFTHTRVTGIDVEAGRVRGVQTEWGPIEAEVVVNAGGMFAAEIGRMAGVRVPVVPFAHEYLVTQPFRERDDAPPAHAARPRPARLLPRGGRRPRDGRLRAPQRAVGAARPTASTRSRRTSTGILLEEDWDRFEEIAVNSRRRVPGHGGREGHAAHQRARGLHPRQRVPAGRERGARLLRRRGLLRARAGGRRRAGQGDGRVDRGRRAGDGPVGDGRPALRRALPLADATR